MFGGKKDLLSLLSRKTRTERRNGLDPRHHEQRLEQTCSPARATSPRQAPMRAPSAREERLASHSPAQEELAARRRPWDIRHRCWAHKAQSTHAHAERPRARPSARAGAARGPTCGRTPGHAVRRKRSQRGLEGAQSRCWSRGAANRWRPRAPRARWREVGNGAEWGSVRAAARGSRVRVRAPGPGGRYGGGHASPAACPCVRRRPGCTASRCRAARRLSISSPIRARVMNWSQPALDRCRSRCVCGRRGTDQWCVGAALARARVWCSRVGVDGNLTAAPGVVGCPDYPTQLTVYACACTVRSAGAPRRTLAAGGC